MIVQIFQSYPDLGIGVAFKVEIIDFMTVGMRDGLLKLEFIQNSVLHVLN